MSEQVRHRTAVRERLRAALVAAARELTVRDGWRGVRMADVANRAGVSRQTVYNEYRDKAALADALVAAELTTFLTGVHDALRAHEDPWAAGHAAMLRALREAQTNPLIRAVLSGPGDADSLMPYLTTHPAQIIQAGSAVLIEWAHSAAPDVPSNRLHGTFESIIRLVISHILYPTASAEQTAADLTRLWSALLTDAGFTTPRGTPENA